MTRPAWRRLREALARRADAGLPCIFWLRDDDAVEPTAALDRLLRITARSAVPVLLAVIPAHAGAALAARLAEERRVGVGVHGWSHANHAPPSEKKQELGPHRPADLVLAELAEGRRRLSAAFGGFVPVLVPPWNRIDPALAECLPGLGFEALSAFGAFRAKALPAINSTVDIIDWHGGRKGRPEEELIDGIVRQIGHSGSVTVGILGHHLVHDEAAWNFLERLFEATAEGVSWVSFRDLMGSAGAPAVTAPG